MNITVDKVERFDWDVKLMGVHGCGGRKIVSSTDRVEEYYVGDPVDMYRYIKVLVDASIKLMPDDQPHDALGTHLAEALEILEGMEIPE